MPATKYQDNSKNVYLFIFYKENTQLYRFGITRQHPNEKINQFNLKRKGTESFVLRYYIEVERERAFDSKRFFMALYSENLCNEESFLFTDDAISSVIKAMTTYECENLSQSQNNKPKHKFNIGRFILLIIVFTMGALIIIKILTK